eukprot:TRINITY_DN34666_c0_g1_i1.p1 TRINITY_DN34666_c0_g1~~TRINITY_DN34666_c0_g1_i1.p1  ORF type:complete len:946 (+),score=109.41 TRINITY_DN34666_c0_g1_i1:402-3239(+)
MVIGASIEEEDVTARAENNADADDADWPLVTFRQLPSEMLEGLFASEDEARCAVVVPGPVAGEDLAVVVGTRQGVVWVLRHGSCSSPVEIGRHGGAITDVSVDDACTFIASSSLDGSIAACPLPPWNTKSDDGGHSRHDRDDQMRKAGSAAMARAMPRWVHTYPRPVLSLALCPDYASGNAGARSVCLGGEDCKLILNRRGAFDSKHLTVHSGEGHIVAVRWRGTLIAWANARGVKVVDMRTYQKVTHIPWPVANNGAVAVGTTIPASCILTWSADDVLLIGCGPIVMIAEVRQKQGGPTGVRFASIAECFNFSPDIVVRSVTAFDADHLAVLTSRACSERYNNSCNQCDTDIDNKAAEDMSKGSARAVHHVCTWSGEILCSASVPCSGEDSFLVSGCGGQPSFVISAQNLLSIEYRGVSDQVDWLIAQGQYEAALILGQTSGAAGGLDVTKEKCRICTQCVRPLLASGFPVRAARVARHLGASTTEEAAAWEECIHLFDEVGELPMLVPQIPAPTREHISVRIAQDSASQHLPSRIYDTVLRRLAAISPGALCAALDRWPSDVYSVGPLMDSLRRALPPALTTRHALEHRRVAEALASLHESQGDCTTAAKLLVQVRSTMLFAFLSRHVGKDAELRCLVRQDVCQLFDVDPEEALELLVEHTDAFEPQSVVDALNHHGRQWQHRYLRLLFDKKPQAAKAMQTLHFELVSELDPHVLCALVEGLSPFDISAEDDANIAHSAVDGNEGASKSNIAHRDAQLLNVCRSHRVFDAEAALLMRRGDWRDALLLLLRELGDVEGAIRVAAQAPSNMTSELFASMISAASNDERALSLLLTRLICTAATPLCSSSLQSLVRSLPSGFEIPRIGAKLSMASDEAEADRELHRLSLELLKSSASAHSLKVFQQHRRGRAVPSKRPMAQAKREQKASGVSELVLRLRAVTLNSL